MNPNQAKRLERIRAKVTTLDRILELCEERAKWSGHRPEFGFYARLDSVEMKRLRDSLDTAVKGWEQELRELWSELMN